MQAKRKPIIIFVVIIMVTGHLLGQVKAAGSLLIPTAGGKKVYKGVITITQAEIEIKCYKKIFRPFNVFDTPRQAKIKFSTAEIEELQINKNTIYIVTKESFSQRYRNIYFIVYKPRYAGLFSTINIKKFAFVFIVDNPADIVLMEKELIKLIGERFRATKG